MKPLRFEIVNLMWEDIRDPIILQSTIINNSTSNNVFNTTWGFIEISVVDSIHQNIRL